MKFNLFYFIALSVASADWTPDSFPNPWTNASGCGIPFKSWICDPDHLLNAKGYGSLQDGLVNLHQSLPVVKCPSSQLVGVLLNVLVVDEIDKKTACPGRMSNLQCLEKFARAIALDWSVGDSDCHNGAILAVSRGLRSGFIVTADGTREVLSDDSASSIVARAMVPYFKRNDYTRGVYAGVDKIQEHLHKKSAVNSKIWVYVIMTVMFVVFVVLPLIPLVFYNCMKVFYWIIYPFALIADLIRWPCLRWKRNRAQQHYEQVAQTLRRPDMTRIGDTKNETTSIKEGEEDFLCPICLESSASSSLPIKTLNCFHSFHTSCIDQWIQNDPRCPICRGDIVWPSPPITKDGDAQSYRQYLDFIVSRFQARHGLEDTEAIRNGFMLRVYNTDPQTTSSDSLLPWNQTPFSLSNNIHRSRRTLLAPTIEPGSAGGVFGDFSDTPTTTYSSPTGHSGGGFSGGGGGGASW